MHPGVISVRLRGVQSVQEVRDRFQKPRIDVHRYDGFMQELQPHQCGVAGSSTCIYVIENGGPSVCLIKSTE